MKKNIKNPTKNGNKKFKFTEKFTDNNLMFPDLTQIKLERAQLNAHIKTTEHIGKILDVLLILIEKIKTIENLILQKDKK